MESEMEQPAVGFEHDIRPLFRQKDIQSMATAFDLSSYGDVKANSGKILDKVVDGTMPCDGAWPEAQVALFRDWVNAGCPA
jgi:hypothetical protein